MMVSMKNPGVAAVLSFLIPGVGQIYNGQFFAALLWLLFTPGFWIGTGGTLGWVCHFLSAWFAYGAASQLSSGSRRRELPSAL